MLNSMKSPIKRLSPWLIAMLLLNLFQSLLVIPASALAQESETNANLVSVFSFGMGMSGQLGHGDTANQLAPKKIEGLSDIQAIAAGTNHSLALTKSGDVYSFGFGLFGRLGHGDTDSQLEPKKIEGLSDIQAIAAGDFHSLALTKSGDVYSFGNGMSGQLGHGDTANQLAPKKIEGLSDIQAIAAGGNHSLALTKSGEVYSFGMGNSGRLGHGDTDSQLEPKKIEDLSDIQAIAAGGNHSLALTKSGDVYSFGWGLHGQLGHGDTENQLTPKKIEDLSDIQAVAAGANHSLALTKSGEVYSFGRGNTGQLGHGDTEDQLTPKKIEGLKDIQAIAAGDFHSLALTKSGDVYSFGNGTSGLGHGDTANQLEPKKIEGLTDIQAIAAGANHSLALAVEEQDSTIHPDEASFDKNILKQREIFVTMELNGNTLKDITNGTTSLSEGTDYIVNGNIVTIAKEYLADLPIGTTTLVFAFSAGSDATLDITVSDSTLVPPADLISVLSFGLGNYGQLGHDDRENQHTPKKIEGLSNIQAIVAGTYHSFALTKSGDVYSFGNGAAGQLGHGDREMQLKPTKIDSLSNVQAIAAGHNHSLALTKSGEVYSFGRGNEGQLGHGGKENHHTPKKIDSLSNVQAIAAGHHHSLALTKSGDVYSFGYGAAGQLGHGGRENHHTPKKIDGLSNVQAIAAGAEHSLALTKSGEVYSFGLNNYGQLGHGDREDQHTPKKIDGLSDIQAIAAGGYHSLALTKSGELYAFGRGGYGQLGHGDTDDLLTPKKIEGLLDIQAIAGGAFHSLALTKSGDVYSFGDGWYGQLGHGDTDDLLTPKKIEGLSNIQAIAAGYNHSLIIQAQQDSAIQPDEASFDKNILKQREIFVTMELNGNTLKDITNGTTSLSEGTDYIVNGNIVTITKEYLANLPIGTTTLIFTFSAGNDATLSVTVSDSTLIPPAGLQATAGDGKVMLSWTATDAVDGYNVYMQEADEGTSPAAGRWMVDNDKGPVTETSYTVDHLTAGNWYWFAVTTVKDEVESGYSDPTSETPYTTVAAVASPGAIKVGKGFALEKLEEYLPEHVQIQLTSLPVTMDAGVKWDLEHADYNPDQVGTYAVTGELQLPGYVRNPQQLQAEIAVHVLPNTNASLSGIALNGEPLAHFDPDIYTYDVMVPYATEQVIVTAATYDPAANYEVVSEVVRGGIQPLKVGINRIDILVTAEDQQEQATYTLYVKRQPDAEAPQWREGDELTVSDITPTSVKLSWPSATDNVGVAGYRIDVDVDHWKPQTVTASVYEFTVTSLRAGTTYTFTVKAFDDAGNESAPLRKQATTARAAGGDSGSGRVLSDNADLADLRVWAGGKRLKLSPSFAAETPAYTARTEAEQAELVVKAAHSAAKVMLDDHVVTERVNVDLEEGPNAFVLTVQAENGAKKIYTLTLYRDTPKPNEPLIEFTDIAGHWAESDIKLAAAKGIVSGYPDGAFKPDHPVTRAEFVKMLAGAMKLEGSGATLTFTDHDQIGVWAKQAVAQAVQAGIVVGYSDGSFRPHAQITRAEMAMMIARALQLQLDANALPGFADDEAIPKWARGAVHAIRKVGIIDGRGDNRFVPNETATRAEAVVMLVRMLDRL